MVWKCLGFQINGMFGISYCRAFGNLGFHKVGGLEMFGVSKGRRFETVVGLELFGV